MKKLMVISVLLTVILVIGAVAIAGNSDKKPGQLKAPLYPVLDCWKVLTDKPAVGWVNFNTNAKGEVIAEVHVDDGIPGEYEVNLHGNISGYHISGTDMTVNNAGKGNAHLKGVPKSWHTKVRINLVQDCKVYSTGNVYPVSQ